MSASAAPESIHTRDFNSMRDYLIAAGAADCALAGTVVHMDERIAFNATYFLDTEQRPPVIAQFIESGGLTALVRVAVSPAGEPLASLTRHPSLPEHPERLLDVDGLPPLRGDRGAHQTFESVYFNVLAFEPNVTG